MLSKDQQYLLDISYALTSGSSPEYLSVREPVRFPHSRWLTTANRDLRLYLSFENPTDEHKILVYFIPKSYMPVWVHIKKVRYFTNGPEHVFEVINSSRLLPENLLKVIDSVIQRNALFVNPENLLLSIIVDKRDQIRELDFKIIIKAKSQPQNINILATDCIEMINSNTITLLPPPLLRRFTNQEIWSKVQSCGTAVL
ncbi:hypothetical protein AVEN_271632-1 [Araneus ventricosus]|uniref:Uncharacterized protein n=1 Tax=Araneus ventricosus TaxID=182803 RepID=A0A4Y2X301_ARAVE|nr:hypothetical protein AVEN_271632-1 [Araneus ventricosus]